MLARLAFLAVIQVVAVVTPGATVPPATMERMVYRVRSEKIPEGSFGTKPMTLVRAGNGYGRSEEAPDPEHKIHGLLIVAEPDCWMINLLAKRGQHAVDPGPTFDFHAQVLQFKALLPNRRIPTELWGLEFGREVEFFKAHDATKKDDTMSLELGGFSLVLTVNPKTQKPTQIQVAQAAQSLFTIEYLSYETGIPFDAALFRPPAGIEIVEAK